VTFAMLALRLLLPRVTAWLLALLAAAPGPPARAHELRGNIAAEGRYFASGPLYDSQERNDASVAISPEYFHVWEGGSSVTFAPFARLDSADEERSHYDVRELNFLWVTDYFELRLGVAKVFWGATEFVHLVDIVNQTDAVENIDGEDKLGQPMVHLSVPGSWGVVDLFVLPCFRERTFPGEKGRLRAEPRVDTDSALYESGEKERHVDFAVRYSRSFGDMDVGVYHFSGTSREPLFQVALREGRPVLVPYYELIEQTGLDAQLVAGEWLLKLEALYRTAGSGHHFAAVGGFEYSFVNLIGGADVGVIAEYAYDDRRGESTSPFENDAMVGLRLAVNDAASTELLAGFVQDLDSSARAASLEASRRLFGNLKIVLEGWAFFDAPEDDPLYGLREDSHLRLELAFYF